MKISQLVSEPKLIEIQLDDADTIAKYGEAISLWIYDRQDIATFAKLAMTDGKNFGEAAELVSKLIYNEDGKPALDGSKTLPTDILMKTVSKVIETLGKLVAPATQETETAKS